MKIIMSFLSRMFKNIGMRDLPIAVGANLGFFAIYLCTKTNCWVDFGWVFNQYVIANVLFFTNPFSLSTIVPYCVISLWAFRLGKHA